MKIAVIGYSCSGKTTLTHELVKAFPQMKVFHTDEYQANGFSPAMYAIMDEVLKCEGDLLVEGVHAYRLLRKGIETNQLHFDAVIECKTDPDKRMNRYKAERDPSKIERLPAFDKSLDKIYRDYLTMCDKAGRKPKIIPYET